VNHAKPREFLAIVIHLLFKTLLKVC